MKRFLFFFLLSTPALADPIEDACIAAAVDGQKQRKAGHLKEARDTFGACAKIECPKEIGEKCTAWVGELESLIPSLVVSVQDENGQDVLDAEVHIDGVPWDFRSGKAVEVDPGVHAIEAAGVKQDVVVREGERTRMIRVTRPSAKKPPPPPIEPDRPLPGTNYWRWAAGISGATSLVATGFFVGFAAVGISDRTSFGCDVGCSPSAYSKVNAELTAADVMLGVAIASAAAGIVFFLVSLQHEPTKPPVALRW